MLTEALLRELYPRARPGHVEAIAGSGWATLRRFGLADSANRLHFFLAQVGHESGGLALLEENLSYGAERICAVWPRRFPTVSAATAYARDPRRLANAVYCDRMGNGPSSCDDGWNYRGRGYIQVTGRECYARLGHIAGLGDRLVTEPDLASSPEHALDVACAFWEWKGLNVPSDAGDFRTVTRRINGGVHGLEDRMAWLDKVRRAFATPSPPSDAGQPSPETAVAVQRALRARGYAEVGAADGVIGRRTLAAIQRFRQDHGLQGEGIDAGLLSSLGVAA